MPHKTIIDKTLMIADGNKSRISLIHQVDETLLVDRIPTEKLNLRLLTKNQIYLATQP